jgi:hypothetical protein
MRPGPHRHTEVSMLKKAFFVSFGLLVATAAFGGGCHGQACRYSLFGKDAQGCLEIQNSGREDIEITVYTASSGARTLRVRAGETEKVYKIARQCVLAVDYIRAEAKYDGGIFSPSF